MLLYAKKYGSDLHDCDIHLLQQSGMEPALSLRYAHINVPKSGVAVSERWG